MILTIPGGRFPGLGPRAGLIVSEAARLILLEAVEQIPNAAVLHYNLACYECQLGEAEVAKARLQHAFNLDPGFRLKALEDEDLAPLWDSLRA